MKIGIIIISYNDENEIDITQSANYFNKLKEIEICLVNNNSADSTYNILEELSEQCTNISLVNIKKFKPKEQAIRAGARYLFNKFNLKSLAYAINDKNMGFNNLIQNIYKNQNAIYNHTIIKKDDKVIRQTIFQKVFSLNDFLNEIVS